MTFHRLFDIRVQTRNRSGAISGLGAPNFLLFPHPWVHPWFLHSTPFPYQIMFVSFNSNKMGVTCVTGTAYFFGTPEFTRVLTRCFASQSSVFCVLFTLFVFFGIALFVLLLVTVSDCLFGIIKLFLSIWSEANDLYDSGIRDSIIFLEVQRRCM